MQRPIIPVLLLFLCLDISRPMATISSRLSFSPRRADNSGRTESSGTLVCMAIPILRLDQRLNRFGGTVQEWQRHLSSPSSHRRSPNQQPHFTREKGNASTSSTRQGAMAMPKNKGPGGSLGMAKMDSMVPSSNEDQMDNRCSETIIDGDSQHRRFPVFLALPPIVAVLSFQTFTWVAKAFVALVNFMTKQFGGLWYHGNSQGELIVTVLNGPLLGVCEFLFGTLTAMTIDNLYQRQLSIRESLVNQVEELRQLALLIASLPEPYQSQAIGHLRSYLNQVLRYDTLSSLDHRASRGGGILLTALTRIRQVGMDPLTKLVNDMLYANNKNKSGEVVPDTLLGQMHSSITRINAFRGSVTTALQTRLPVVHYWNLASLAVFVAILFLLQVEQDVTLFLSSIQVKFLWSMLISLYTLIGCVLYDLATPFSGTYRVFVSTRPNEQAIQEYVLGPLVSQREANGPTTASSE